MSWRVLEYFGLGSSYAARTPFPAPADEDDPALMMTGDTLITSILENIRLRRSVLVTGPRGCGKSYCTEQAIKQAKAHGIIGGSRFLQGNREIPRDALSEDMLIVGQGGKVELLKALALRPLEESGSVMREGFPDWPGIPRGMGLDPMHEWSNRDWMVLFLDEINRFGDGFLDSLLALLEERKIVRRGQDYYVPIVVVATANPPGYDMTAKKLSPPLQARITRSFRVSQPDVDVLVNCIMPTKIEAFARESGGGRAPAVSEELRYLAAGTTLCLWGDPAAGSKGRYFLTKGARTMLRRLMDADSGLARDMKEISALIDFGPDARAVTDWVSCAMARAMTEGARELTVAHLAATAVHVLSHKVREKFNEGANPNLGIRRDQLIMRIVSRVLQNPYLAKSFGYSPSKRAPAAPKLPRAPEPPPVSEADLRQVIGGFRNAAVFAEIFVAGFNYYRSTVLPTIDHARIWINAVDGVLQPYASPADVQQLVGQGFFALVRALRPGQRFDMETVTKVGQLYMTTFDTLAKSSNPAGRERAEAAKHAVQHVLNAAKQSPANPRNSPQATSEGVPAWKW